MKRQLSIVAFVLVTTACSSFDSTSSPGVDSPDASNGASPLGPSSQYRLDVTATPSSTAVTRGTNFTVSVKVVRLGGLSDDVAVGLKGAPAGVTAKSRNLTYPSDSVDLEVTVDATAPQGATAGLVVSAQSLLRPEIEADTSLALNVRGRAGELDTTFAVGGVLDAGRNGPIAVDPSGRIYAFSSDTPDILRRYQADGAVDATFVYEPHGRQLYGDPQFVFRGDAIYEFYSLALATKNVEKHLSTGSLDKTFAGVGYFDPKIYGFGRFLAIAPDGHLVVGAADESGTNAVLYMFDGSGGVDTRISSTGSLSYGRFSGFDNVFGRSPRPRAGIYDTDKIVSLNSKMIVVMWADPNYAGNSFDPRFNGGTPLDFGNVTLGNLVQDSSTRYVVAGLNAQVGGPTGLDRAGLYMARVFVTGKVDSTFAFHEPGVTATDTRLVVNPLGSSYYLATTEIVDEHTYCHAYRVNADGSIDDTFGSAHGIAVGAADCTIADVFTQPDGRVLVGTPQKLYRFWN